MAPPEPVKHDELEQQLKDIIQDFYSIMVQTSTYDSMGRPSKDVLVTEIKTLSTSLQTLHASASPPNALPSIPPELLEYVDNGRNPDIYTREFVELVRRGNQLMRGKLAGFGAFRDVLAEQMAAAMPELREDVAVVCEATGGGGGHGHGHGVNGGRVVPVNNNTQAQQNGANVSGGGAAGASG